MMPSTPRHFRSTKRESFTRRMSMIDRPVLVITFQGVIGDFIKSNFFFQNDIANLPNVRLGAVKSLKVLS